MLRAATYVLKVFAVPLTVGLRVGMPFEPETHENKDRLQYTSRLDAVVTKASKQIFRISALHQAITLVKYDSGSANIVALLFTSMAAHAH